MHASRPIALILTRLSTGPMSEPSSPALHGNDLRLRPEALTDLREAMAWYEERESGLGAAFLADADAAFERIAAHPSRYAAVHGPFYRALMRRFPYAI
jgi:hypothetical protein